MSLTPEEAAELVGKEVTFTPPWSARDPRSKRAPEHGMLIRMGTNPEMVYVRFYKHTRARPTRLADLSERQEHA